ncbi:MULTISPECIES: LysM peptidoglycan-binding domain-containing protein [Streptomyces]|uniref:CIS tube protein n=1 Tax=Streptomyces TaxID=1883 RepID=UPI0009985E07|nr:MULTISPECIES: LysM peptidoglycan-binding domain-containing protein [Streptomyces]AQW55420.1 peptidoglycan-binding protein [Streptomyces hygroscopicus]ASQ99271.1 peptidoglycan-binding protein [Streptomyces sp. 11-1-2]
MSVTPVSFARQGSAKARLEIVRPVIADERQRRIPLRFNPTDYKLSKSNTFAEITIPGLETPPLQYVRGGTETLTVQALVDTSDTLENVRKLYVNAVRNLLRPDSREHAPPVVRFVWDEEVFTGVVEKLDVNYQLFRPDGVPLRAMLDLSLKEFRTAAVQVAETPRSSPTVEKSYVVRRGDTLSSISAALYRRPDAWRELARANGISDPRELRPGRVLTVPRLP